MTSENAKAKGISAFWVLVIVVPLIAFGLWVALDHANANQDETQARANRQFAKALIVTDRKFSQALRVATKQFAYSINRSVCGFRSLLLPSLASYKQAAKDQSLSASAKQRNAKRIKSTQEFLNTQVTVPADFNCTSLPKRPPKP